jgi:ribonucleotide reductase beta subunit family protein with ferritin-like domain
MFSIKYDPLIHGDDERFVLYPIKHKDIYDLYKRQVACFWTAEEVDLSKDLADYTKLSKEERHFVNMILAFFAGADGLVSENLASRFYNDVKIAEARLFYGFQIAMEGIHQETYSNLIDTYIKDKEEKERLFFAMNAFPCITKKADFAKNYMTCQCPFSIRLVGFACVEAIQFSGAFCALFWLRKRNLLQGLTFSNQLISRDEALHAEFAVCLYNKLKEKLSQKKIHEIIKEAVDIEIEFICDAIPCRLIGMNSILMVQYIKFVANRLCLQLGTNKLYEDATNPFDFMESISIETKTNFFESRVAEYALATKSGADTAFQFDMNF